MSETTDKQIRKKLVAGNWKMNGSFDANEALILGFLAEVDEQVDVSVFCPFPYLSQVGKLLENQGVAFGSQDVSSKASGAYTGEVSAGMLHEFGCRYVIVGQSERRSLMGEDDAEPRAERHALEPLPRADTAPLFAAGCSHWRGQYGAQGLGGAFDHGTTLPCRGAGHAQRYGAGTLPRPDRRAQPRALAGSDLPPGPALWRP